MSDEGLLTADNPSPAGEGTEDVFASVSKEIRFSADGNDKLARFQGKGISDIATSFLELERMDSGKIKMPNEESSSEEKSAFYQKLGTPLNTDGYTNPTLKEGQTFDEAFLGEMKSTALESNVSAPAFEKLVEKYMFIQEQAEEAKVAAQNAEAETTTQALQGDWKADFDKNLEISRRGMREVLPEAIREPFIELMKEKNLDNNEIFIRGFKAIGDKMLDDTFVKGTQVKKEEGDYTPKYPKSPEMYKGGDDEESIKGRAWHTARGYSY